jgi:hypothetical protein
MIHIDYQGGAHGNYLEFVCNKIAGITVGTPFRVNGTAHAKTYTKKKIFYADHYSRWNRRLKFDKIISIRINVDDLLPFQQIAFLRSGEYGYDNDLLEIDTYNKFNNIHYQQGLDTLLKAFFTNQIRDSYDAVRDPAWPDVNTLADFHNLPESIKQECIELHKLILLELSPAHPNCPRYILREFFQIGFEHPDQHDFIVRQNQVKYDASKQVYQFEFKHFYDKNKFLQDIKNIVDWTGFQYNQWQDIEQLHDEFLQNQPYKKSKAKCDNIIMELKNNNLLQMPKVDLLEEAYINAKLGWDYFK